MKYALQLGLVASVLALSAASAVVAQQSKPVAAVNPGTCQAAYNAKRNNCTLVGGQCAPGYFPVANPPACNCACLTQVEKKAQEGKK
jgi:hypothetical protein